MNPMIKKAAAVATLVAAVAVAATPSEARWHGGRAGTAAAIGFGAGALVGAAAASSYYGGGYGYYGDPYASYGYAYDPAPAYVVRSPRAYWRGRASCLPSSPNPRGC